MRRGSRAVRFKADASRVRPAPGALRRVQIALDPAPERAERRSALVRVGSTVKLLRLGSGFADLRRVQVVSLVGPRRAAPGGTAVPADTHDLTEAIQAFTTRRYRMEREGTRRGRAYERVRNGLGLAFTLGGEAEVAYPRAC